MKENEWPSLDDAMNQAIEANLARYVDQPVSSEFIEDMRLSLTNAIQSFRGLKEPQCYAVSHHPTYAIEYWRHPPRALLREMTSGGVSYAIVGISESRRIVLKVL